MNSTIIFVTHHKLTLQFSNPGDGIQSIIAETKGNRLRLPHHAPLDGYKKEYTWIYKRSETEVFIDTRKKNQNFFFRVRTKRDDKGNIISAHYGKIHGNTKHAAVPSKKYPKPTLSFSYYLNPNDMDTNLEFDPEKSLFPKPDGHKGRYWFNP